MFHTQLLSKPISDLKKEKQETSKPKERERERERMAVNIGFSAKRGFELSDTENLDVPTIKRMKKSPDLFNNLFDLESGFKTTEPKPERNDYYNDGEEDSSSFLRKIMD